VLRPPVDRIENLLLPLSQRNLKLPPPEGLPAVPAVVGEDAVRLPSERVDQIRLVAPLVVNVELLGELGLDHPAGGVPLGLNSGDG
jgi:hypothetical protein